VTPAHAEARREARFVLARVEARVLRAIAERLPRALLPDHLTAIGILGSTVVAASYVLSNLHVAWLIGASLGLGVNWFGDSLDGTVARLRRIQRPRYGFYVDHLTDAYSTLAIGLGLGWSPFLLLSVGLTIVIAYFLLSINVYLETHVHGTFRFSYGRLGPTEARLALVGLNTLALVTGPLPFDVLGVGATLFDCAGLLAVIVMLMMLTARIGRNLRELAEAEPPNVVKASPNGGDLAGTEKDPREEERARRDTGSNP
jgi:phosphatidylglycerophosphate synthase